MVPASETLRAIRVLGKEIVKGCASCFGDVREEKGRRGRGREGNGGWARRAGVGVGGRNWGVREPDNEGENES